MIGGVVTQDGSGNPVDGNGKSLTQSAYQPSPQVQELYARCQMDYQVAYSLQHRSFNEFDGLSLLDRTRRNQETFGAFVGAEYLPRAKRWKWRGRKNTARNKLLTILAQLLAAMLYPYVMATNDKNEQDKLGAQVMRILIEAHLRKAGYEVKFLFMVLTALVNPAVIVGVEYVEAFQKAKQHMADGTMKITQVVDELLTGLHLNIIPIDQFLVADFYTPDIQLQPYVIFIRRIPYDQAKSIYKGRFFDQNDKDLFDYVHAGQTRTVLSGNENQTLYDIEWTEADGDYVQEITFYYRSEDLQVTWVGGVFMGETDDVYNSNSYQHRRTMLLPDGSVATVPVNPFAHSGFEPIDPTGRFFYFESGAHKEYWDDKSINEVYSMIHNATALDTIKPVFLSGVGKVDQNVMVPGATIGMPAGAQATPYSMSPNLAAAWQVLAGDKADMGESTVAPVTADPNLQATVALTAQKNAQVKLGLFGAMIASLIKQIGELVVDVAIQYDTVGELDATVPEAIDMKFKAIIHRGKDKGKSVVNQVIFTTSMMGNPMTKEQKTKREWELFDKAGGATSDQRIYEVNPYAAARLRYQVWLDADEITDRSMGADKARKQVAFNMLTDSRVAPFTDTEAVVNDFVIDEYSDGDPDRYKRKGNAVPGGQTQSPDMLNAMMGAGAGAQQPQTQLTGSMPQLNAGARSPYSLPVTAP